VSRSSKSTFALSAMAVLAVGLTACSSSGGTSSHSTGAASTKAGSSGGAGGSAPIVVGNVGSYSGAQASSEAGAEQIIKAWAQWVNAHGGIRGHQVKLIVKDDQNDPTKALAAVRELVQQDKVVALVGEQSNSDAAWAKYVAGTGVPVVGGLAINTPFLTNPDFFPSGTNALALSYATLANAKAKGGPFGFLYCAESPLCAQSVPLYQGLAKAVGVKLPVLTKVSGTAPDYTAQCVALKDSHATSYQVGSAAAVAFRVAQACQSQGVKAALLADGGSVTQGWTKVPAVDGTVSAESNFPFTDSSVPATKEYQQAKAQYAPRIGDAEGEVAAGAWAAGKLFEAAVAKSPAGAVTSSSVKTGLYALKDETLGGLTPPLTFTAGKPALVNCYFNIEVTKGKVIAPQGLKTSCSPDAVIAAIASKIS
jgi:branched-chain amino acid transport system substrate-binding protein